MSNALVMIDGRVCPPAEQVVSVYDRGFLYGDSVFETLRTYSGRVFELSRHLERLARSAASVFIQLPIGLPELAREIEGLVSRAGHPESYVRVMITRGAAPLSSGTPALGLDPALAERPTRVIIVQELHAPPPRQYTDGVKAISYRTTRLLDGTSAAGSKVGNYLVSVLAMREAAARGAAEALIVDREGQVLEGASSNVFLVRAGALITPPIEAGILDGVTRRHVIAAAGACGLSVRETVTTLEQAQTADELFITSSIREMLPVVQLDERPLGAGRPGPIFRQVLARFRARVAELSAVG